MRGSGSLRCAGVFLAVFVGLVFGFGFWVGDLGYVDLVWGLALVRLSRFGW